MRKSEEIKRKITLKEERLGRELSKEERRKIEKSVIRKHRRENFIRGLFLTIGIGVGAGGTKALESAKTVNVNQPNQETSVDDNNNEKNSNGYKESLRVSSENLNKSNSADEEKIDYNEIQQEIINEYNEKYNDNLTEQDQSFIKSNPQFVGIDENNNYIQDYKEETPVSQYKTDGIGNIYVVIDDRNDNIIYSVGKIDDEVVNVDTKVVMTSENGETKEYFASNNTIDPTENKDKESIEDIYNTLEYEYNKQIEEEKEESR